MQRLLFIPPPHMELGSKRPSPGTAPAMAQTPWNGCGMEVGIGPVPHRVLPRWDLQHPVPHHGPHSPRTTTPSPHGLPRAPPVTHLLAEHKPSASGRTCPLCLGGTRLQGSKGEKQQVRGGCVPTKGPQWSQCSWAGSDGSQGSVPAVKGCEHRQGCAASLNR